MIKSILHKRDNGIWYVIVRYTDINGKQKDKWISTKTKQKNEALLQVNEIQKKYAYLDYGEMDNNIEVATYLALWKEKQRDTVCTTTYEAYETYFDKHLIPDFAKKGTLLRNLTAKQVDDYIFYLQHNGRLTGDGGLSLAMTRKIFFLLKKALDDAVIQGYIDYNPAQPVKVKEVNGAGIKQVKNVLHNKEECQTVLDAFQGHFLQPIVYITLYYGLRRSEVLGLQWKSVDFDNDTFTIEHTVVKCKTVIEKDDTKTNNSRATMRMLPEIKQMLLKIKEQQKQNREFWGSQYVENDYVFVKENGAMYYPDTITQSFQVCLESKGLPPMRFHDLRKSTASWLFNSGWDINDVREWLRHADIETTANIYTEISKEKVKSLGEDIAHTFRI